MKPAPREPAPTRAGARVTGFGWATPAVTKQVELGAWYARHLAETLGPHAAPSVADVFSRSPIAARPIGLLDPAFALQPPRVGAPWTLDDAMRAYHAVAPELAVGAARQALRHAGLRAEAVTHLVFVSSTGVGLPGPEIEVIERLGLSPGVGRVCVAGMGCSGAFYGIEAARSIATTQPAATVLVVCVEVCSAHLRSEPSRQSIVAHSLFGDAAAALVVRGAAPRGDTVVELGPLHGRVLPEHRELIRWDLGRDGFGITLSPRLPVAVGRVVEAFSKPLVECATAGGAPRDVASWAVHPGGSAILDKIEHALTLAPPALASSRALFAARGNLSSPAVLGALAAERGRHAPGTRGVMLGFGPGLALAGAVYRFGEREVACPF